MNIPAWNIALWDAINRYARRCGGDPSKHVYGNTPRQLAVVDVESAVKDAVEAERVACETILDEFADRQWDLSRLADGQDDDEYGACEHAAMILEEARNKIRIRGKVTP